MLRLKGQETEVRIIDNGNMTTLTEVKSADIEPQFDILQEGYLGKTTDDYDDIFRGVSGKIELHLKDDAMVSFLTDMIARSTRRTPGLKINIQTRLNFPNGVSRLAVIRDAFFSTSPINIGSREAFVTFTLNFKSGNLAFL